MKAKDRTGQEETDTGWKMIKNVVIDRHIKKMTRLDHREDIFSQNK